MVWLIVVAALVVLGLAAWAGTGRFGAMPEVVNDAPRPVLPPGVVDQEFLDGMELPLARYGYDTAQVEAYFQAHVDGESAGPPALATFGVVRRGYAMPAVDEVMSRIERDRIAAEFEAEDIHPEAEADEPVEAGVQDEEIDAEGPPRRALT